MDNIAAGVNSGEMTDGYHTFNELYRERAVLFACLCSCNSSIAWKTRRHPDGTMESGFFLAGMSLPGIGDVSFHITEDCWDMFSDVKELEYAPPYDGYTADDVMNRLLAYFKYRWWD